MGELSPEDFDAVVEVFRILDRWEWSCSDHLLADGALHASVIAATLEALPSQDAHRAEGAA